MGCDIHMWAEVLQTRRNGDRNWECVGREFPYQYYTEGRTSILRGYTEEGSFESYETNERLTATPYNGRNYDLFAILANVRNGSGFAGVDTGDGFKPIDTPRGVPSDASEYYRHEVDAMGIDGHSHSWLTLDELVAFDWDGQVTTHRGWVNKTQFDIWQATGKPEERSGGVSGGSVRLVSNETMAALPSLPDDGGRFGGSDYTQVSWEESYADSCRMFLDETMPRLQEIAARDDVDALRLVFFFDN